MLKAILIYLAVLKDHSWKWSRGHIWTQNLASNTTAIVDRAAQKESCTFNSINGVYNLDLDFFAN